MLSAVHPKLPMRNYAITKAFYVENLGFEVFGDAHYQDYLMLTRDGIQLHFFLFEKLDPKENYGQVYLRTDNIDALYEDAARKGIVHPSGHLQTKPWGQRECSVLDPDNNLLTFGQP